MRKSSKARLFSTCLTGAILAAASPAWGQTSDAPTWKPRAEVDAQVGKDIGVSTSLFAPIAQNDSSLVYVDGRIGYDQRFDRNGSATIGARVRVGEDAAIGVNAGADFYRSDIGSRDQAAVSMGLEGFTSVFDARVNYRLPLSKTRTIGYIDPAASGSAALVLENNRLIERHSGFRLEAVPLQGFNGEAGVRLPVGGNASIRGSVGGFTYWDKDADENYRGIRGGLEMDIEDRNSGARFTFGGTVEHDNRFGTDARATVRLSVPFGGRSGDRGAVPTGLDRQMGDRVRRDYVARSGSRYRDLTSSRFAVDARTGNEFGGFYYASGTGVVGAAGTLATPTTINDAVTRAGANGVVVALGNGGNITTPGVTLATNQYLLGGAGAVDVRLLNGGTAQFALGGTNGVIVGSNAAGATVTLGQGSVVRDVTIRGAGTGIAANGVGGFALDRVIVENTGGAGISLTNTLGSVALTGLTVRGGAGAGVLVNGGSSVSLANSTISGGAGAVDINDGGANLAVSLSGLTLSATGGNVLDIDGSGAGTVTVTGLSGITIRGGTGETGGLSVRSATFDANTTTAGIQTVNAGRMEVGTTAARVNGQGVFLTDVIGSLSFTDLDIANSGATGLRVVNSKVNSFTLATLDGTIDTIGGTAADLDPLVIDLNFASISSVGATGPGVILNTVQGGGTGGNALTIGTLTISNSGGDGLVILNSTGLVRVNGGAITNSGGSSVRIGTQGVAGSGGSTNLIFGASITDAAGASPIVAIFNAAGTINFTGAISGSGGIAVQDTLAGSAITFGAITLTGTAGDAITLNNLAGSINFAGLVTIANPGANGIVVGNVPGGVTFGNVDITGLGNFTGLDVTGAHGNVLFTTLDITGTGGGKGIDVTGSTNAGNVIVLNGSTIQGVNIGVDLTQANMTGQFRFGDGNPVPLNSTIAANVPIVIALMNASNGSYNFADANLVGDTSNLTGAGFTAYYARVGATGAGTRSDPGSLAGADASNAQYIVLLNDSAGGQDVFDAASAGGSFDLAAGQSLVSFLNGDFVAVSGAGLPANLTVSGIGPAGITNVYAGSGAAILTTTTAGSATVNLSNNSRIDGLVIRNAGNDVGVEGVGVSGVTIANSDIGGSAGAIAISDGGAAASVTLTHLDLSSSGGTTLSLSGAGAGTLTVSASDVDIAATGTSAAASLIDLSSGGIAFGTISTGTSASSALTVQGVTGGGVAIGSVAVGGTGAGAGVAISGNGAAVTIGAVSVAGSAGDAVQITNNSGAVSIGAVSASASGGDSVALSGNSGTVALGALSSSGAAGAGLNLQNILGNVTVGSASIGGGAAGVSINGVSAAGTVTISGLAVTGSGTGVTLADVDGSVSFAGTTSIVNPGTSGIVIGAGSAGTISFGDVDITGLGAGTRGVDARNASGTVNFNTLDIAGSSTTGTRGIDLTGATFATNFTTTESGSITGVGIGVDLTNAAITGSFRYGDGSNTDADGPASSINAVTPIVITGINVGTGSYNFLDVVLAGDTSTLSSSATLYFVKAGATGVGTIADPGSLAGAEASAADTIILLNDPTGGQDILDAAGAGGSFDLAAGRSLLSFLNGDTLTLPGGAPANLLLFGIPSGQIGNPFAGSGAPVLTTTMAGTNTVNLGGSNLLDGLVIGSGVNGIGVVGSGVANITIRNSNISGPGGAIALSDAGLSASVALSNLTLSSTGGMVAFLDGTGGGTLAVTQLNGITIQGGNGEVDGFYADGVLFDADLATAGAQAVIGSMTIGAAGARVNGTGLVVNAGEGSLDFVSLDVVNANNVGVVLNGNLGLTAIVRAGSIDTLGDDALVGVNAALTLDFGSIVATGGGIFMIDTSAATTGEPVLNVATLNLTDGGLFLAGSGDYVFTNASITDSVGVAVFLADSANLDYSGDITSNAGAAITLGFQSHTGTASFHDGTIDVTDGAGFQFVDADGTYSFTGTTTLHGGNAGINIASGSSGSFFFDADTSVTNGAIANFLLQNSDANVTYLGSLTQGLNANNFTIFGQTGGVVDFSQATISASAGSGLRFLGADGTSMLGDVQLSGGAGIEITGSGAISFGNVDITGLGANQTAVDLTGALGNVTFQTLDIAGASTVGSKGIDLTGNTGTGDIVVTNSSTITGVGVGVDLTNASRTGLFQYGDGESAIDVASTITATTPLVITGLNGGTGTYNFADVNLIGDTSGLVTSVTTYFVAAGATGAGTMADPGSLTGAEASGAQVIVLLNDPAGGQDVLDAFDAGGSFDLAAGQSLLGFLNGDTLTLPGGGPANLLLFGLTPGQIVNPFAGSGAPVLTNSTGANTLNLASNTLVDGILINAPNGLGIFASDAANVTIRNSNISAGGNAIMLADGAAGTSASLSNLLLAGNSSAVLNLDGTGLGTLTLTALNQITIAGGNGELFGIYGSGVTFDADLTTAGFQTVSGTLDIGSVGSRVTSTGIFLVDTEGAAAFDMDVATDGGSGVLVQGGPGALRFDITGGTIDALNSTGYGLYLANASADVVLASITYAGTATAVSIQNVAGVGPLGRAIDVATLTVADNAASAIAMSASATGSFSFGAGSSIGTTTSAAISLANTGASTFNYAGSINYAGAAAVVSVAGGHSGTANFTGAINASSGTGLVFNNADGTYAFNGTTTLNGGDAGIDIVNGSAGNFNFGSGTSITSPSGVGIDIQNSTASVTYSGNVTYATAGQAAVRVVAQTAGGLDLQSATLNISGGTGLSFDDADGTYQFGSLTLSGGAGIAVLNGSAGGFTFGDVDITGLGANQTAVDLTGATGNVTFNTLDITGTSAVGSKGIDLTGNTGTGDIVVTNSSTITGVGVGVDLTNASRTGLFQYGDGESAIDVASTITATTPLVVTGLNGGTGTYNFADVNLVGDNSALATTATVYYVLAGASGSGTLGDPGSLAGAEAAAADIIILLNDPTGGQDVLDALGSNGNDTLALDVNQALRSFLNGDTITLPGGAPANVILTGVVTGQITNPYAGSGAPILTTTGAANTVTLANNSLIDGVVIQSASGFAGVYGSGLATVTLSNATLSGTGTALRLLDGGAAATATLTNLSLSASGGGAAVDFSGAGAGSLTLTGSGLNVSHSGSGALLTIADIVIGGGNLSFGNVVSTASGGGVDLGTIGGLGTLSFGNITVAGATADGVALHNSSAIVDLGDVAVTGAAGAGIALTSNSGAITIGSLDISTSATGLSASGLTGTLTVGDGTIDDVTVAGILIGAGNTVLLDFGNIDITSLQTGARGVDARLAGGGNVTFETLDISGASAIGTRGIDLTGNAGTGNFVVANGSAISGVGIGVDLTNAARTGLFQYGDGNATPLDSSISATSPIIIAGLNGGIGTYDFVDVALTGDTSGLATSATVYYVLAGATGIGTLADPGSLAGAEAATADFIILLNDPTGGQDVLDAAGTNGNDTLALDVSQILRSFRDGNTITLPGGAPANVILTGVVTGQVTNPYAASALTATDRAPILTTTGADNTVTLANNSLVDGVFVRSVVGSAGVFGSGRSGVTISNATIFGPGHGLLLLDGGAAASATLTNLDVSSSGSGTALGLAGNGAGMLTVAGSGINVSHSGLGALLAIDDIVVDGANLSFGTVASTTSAAGVDLGRVAGFGTLSFGSINVAGASASAVALHDSSATVNLGNVTVSGAPGTGIALTANSGAITIGAVDISASATGLAATGLTNTLTVGSGTIDGASVAGILFGAGNTGAITFGDINITGLQTGARGVDARLTGGGNVYFETLDISGASATGTRGIDLTGNTASTGFIINESSTITGVGIGVDLTNVSRTGTFRYGDGSNIDFDLAASTINATTPIVIAGLNGATGTYDFRDATLVGDTSPLEVSAFFVRAGATGVGSRSDPGSLAAADASTASFIVLLDTQAGAGSFDTISGTLTLANNQSLLSFRDADTFNVGGGAPPNVFVFNVTTGTITNPNSGSGAPLLTSADATGTVQLAGTSVIDGVVVSNTGTGAGIFANGTAGLATIRNSTISGGGAAVDIRSGALVRTVNLQNLTLANAGNQAGALLNLDGTGGTLTVTGMSNLTINTAGGETAGLVFNTVTFDSDLATGGNQAVNAGALTIGTTGARVQGDGLSLTNVSGSLTFSDLDIANTGGTGLLVANSKANSFLLTTADGSYDTTFGTAVNLDPLVVNMTLSSVTATNGAYGIQLDQVEGFFTVTGAVNVTNATIAGITIENNTGQTDALDATFNGAVTINNTVGAGLSLTNNAGATIIFGGGGTGVDVVTTGGAALNASGGTLSIAGSGNSLTSGTGQTMALSGLTVGAPGINFGSVSANGAATAVMLTGVTASGGGVINLGTVNLQGITSRGIDVNTALGAALSITDLDIGLNSTTAVAVDLNGAALAAGITANDFDVTNAAAAGTSIAVDLRGTIGGQVVRLGDTAVGGAAASIAGVNTGVWLNAATNATFTYGDGESATDGTSTISAVTGIDASAAPVAGTYNFTDVTFGASPGLGFGIGRTWFVDSNGATGGGNGSGADGANPMTLAAAELALATTDVIVLVNNGSAISAAGSNGNDTLNLLADTQVRGFGQGSLALTLTVPATILLSGNTINIADPTGNGPATLTSAAAASVITLGASGNRISGFILDGAPAGALRGIVDAAGATGTVIDFMTIRNFNQVGGYGIEITPSTSTTIDNVTFTGNTNDVLLNAAGSTITNVTATGATGTSITIDNATGTTTLTNVAISGAATGLSFTNAGGGINATNVDIDGAAASALTISGGTASFTFDGTSSIVQAVGGLTLNVANHSTGTLAFAGLINATSGNGMQFNNADGIYNFPGITTLNGGNAGIDIYNGATGTFTFGPATSLTHNGAGNAFVLLSSANVTFDGTIIDNDGTAVEIDGHDAGTATFNGSISSSIGNASTVISIINSNGGAINFTGEMAIASTGPSVVSLSANDGGTITFNAGGAGLDITNTTGTGMIITGGGTVNVQGAGNSITTTSGTLLSITNTGATTTTANLAFATASNTSGANGIFVQRTAGALSGTVNIGGGAITATTRGVSLNGDALNFTYGGTLTTSGAASRAFEATNRTGGIATLSGNITDTSLGISIASNTGGMIIFSGQTISLNTGANNAVTLSNNTGTTINFAPLAGGNGLDIVTTSGTGFTASGGGTINVTGAGNSIQTGTGQVVNLSGVSAGASGITWASLQSTGVVTTIAINLNNLDSAGGGAFSGGTTSIAGTGGGNDAIFIGNGSGANVAFGATTLGTGGNVVSGDGIEINGSGNGLVTFTSVDIDNTTAHGISIIGAAGATGGIAINGGTIGAGGAGSIGGDGVNVTGGSGTITVAASIAKTNAGNVVEVSGHTAGTVTFSNTISATGNAANGILLNNNTGGSIVFSGTTKTISTGTNNAIQFDNTAGTGAAVSFTGGNLDIDTTSGRGITATSTTAGAGSLTITGSNNTITSVGGVALNLVNTNIAAGGLNFLSVSANGGARGIVLNTTGGAGGLTITGTGTTDGSGGTIQNITARGIELLNTALVNISNLNLTNASTTGQAAGQDLDLTTANGAIYMSGVATAVFENINITGTIADNGITGINVSNFQLNNSLITGAGDGAHESGIEFSNLSGTSSLTNTEIALSETNSLDIVNTDVNLNLTLNNVIFRDTQSSGIGEGGLQFRSFSNAAGTPTTNIDVIDSDFLRIRTQGIQIIGEDDSVVSIDITNSVIDSQTGIGAGIDINGNDTSTVRFNIIGNPTIRSSGGAAINITSFISANVMGRISNNADIEVYSQTPAGTGASGSGVRLLAQENSHLTVAVTGNTLTQGAGNNSAAVDVIAREGSARLDLTLTGNVIDSTDVNTLADINLQSGSSSGTNIETNQIYANIANNNLTGTAAPNLLRLRVSELDNTHDPRIFLQGFVEGGAGIEDDAVATWNANGNTPGATAANIAVSLTGTATGPSAGTAQTPTNPLP